MNAASLEVDQEIRMILFQQSLFAGEVLKQWKLAYITQFLKQVKDPTQQTTDQYHSYRLFTK